MLDQRGVAQRFISMGKKHHVVLFAGAVLQASDRATRHPYTLALWQAKIEQILADWVSELAVKIYRGRDVVDLAQDDTGVDIALNDGRSIRSQYLVGCDGGRSLVRKKAGIAFPGWDADISYLIFEADLTDPSTLGIRHGEKGIYAVGPLDDGRRFRGVVTEQHLQNGSPSAQDLKEALIAAYGTDLGVHDIAWLSRFSDAARLAATYRAGRVLIAGDAAHVHSPVGGQGLNLGLQDAVNLGWKLGQVVKGVSPESLLDTYDAERRPVGESVLKHTLALTALNRGDERTNALRAMISKVMQMDEPRKWYSALMSGLDIQYDVGEGHPLLGRRIPDLDVVTRDGQTNIFRLLHDAKPLLVNTGDPGSLDIAGWTNRLKPVDVKFQSAAEVAELGSVETPTAVLIRPDGHVAWIRDANDTSLKDALTSWFGAPEPP